MTVAALKSRASSPSASPSVRWGGRHVSWLARNDAARDAAALGRRASSSCSEGRGSSGARYASARCRPGTTSCPSRGGRSAGRPAQVPRRGVESRGLAQGRLRVDTIATVLGEGGFVACIHAVGMLLASDVNALASGSGSKPSPGATYDDATRVTASTPPRRRSAVRAKRWPGRGLEREGGRVSRPCPSCSGPPPRRGGRSRRRWLGSRTTSSPRGRWRRVGEMTTRALFEPRAFAPEPGLQARQARGDARGGGVLPGEPDRVARDRPVTVDTPRAPRCGAWRTASRRARWTIERWSGWREL